MDAKRGIPAHLRSTRERKKRQREIVLAGVGVVLIFFLTWIELRLLGVSSYLFFGLFNLNLILLILVLFLVLRNVIKLFLERRRRIVGSGLRARLVGVFVTLSLVPTLIMFFIALWFVRTSVDYWFQAQVETSMDQALSIGQDFYAAAEDALEVQARGIVAQLRPAQLTQGGRELENVLRSKKNEYGLTLVGVFSPARQELAWQAEPAWAKIWPEVLETVPWEDIDTSQEYWATLWTGKKEDVVVGILPLGNQGAGYVIAGDTVGRDILARLEQIAQGVREYKQLRTLKYPVKMTLYMVLGLMTLLILLGATWFGFRLAKEISRPVQALAAGTQRIARGDLAVRLVDDSQDELGLLVQSFNTMAADLEQSQNRLTQAKQSLEEQNRELASNNQYVQAILENITAGVVSLDRSGHITTMNKAAGAIVGVEAAHLLGQSALDILGPEHQELIEEVAQLLYSSPGFQWQRRLELNIQGQPLKLLVNIVALMDAEGQQSGMLAVFENISELEKMQRLDAWKEVAQRIAHEIKNPLTPIKLSAERLERKFAEDIADPVFRQCTGLIVKQVEHLQEMVHEFSAFAKLPEVTLVRADLVPLLRETVAVFSSSHTHIQWRVRTEPEAWTMLDPEAMKRTFFNIFLNAAEVLGHEEGGRVEAELYTRSRKGRIYIEIRDNGPGIKPEEQVRMFEPYYSTKRGGSGLGLAIVKSIITDHHGHVRVKAHEPGGTTFILELPSVRSDVHA
ncbi:MAG: HAMP domain-containing protein [Desulfovibrionales bacterium]|nr:HAMP domain-containing protein [Desulfovibrionales bacterium]